MAGGGGHFPSHTPSSSLAQATLARQTRCQFQGQQSMRGGLGGGLKANLLVNFLYYFLYHLYLSHLAHIYTFVPLVMNEHENQGAKMIRMFMCDLSDLEIHITCSLIKQQKKAKKILVSGGKEVQKAENPHLTPPCKTIPPQELTKLRHVSLLCLHNKCR